MIDYVSGKLSVKKPTEAVIDIQGLGYKIHIPTSTFEALPDPGEPATLFTHHYVRDDAILLYGFATTAERNLFRLMILVSGIGPKLALATLSAMSPLEVRDHVLNGDTSLLTKIPGVGRKTAERLVIELRDRLAGTELPDSEKTLPPGHSDARTDARDDARAALESLGLNRAAAERSLRKVLRQHPTIQSAEELVRLALRES